MSKRALIARGCPLLSQGISPEWDQTWHSRRISDVPANFEIASGSVIDDGFLLLTFLAAFGILALDQTRSGVI